MHNSTKKKKMELKQIWDLKVSRRIVLWTFVEVSREVWFWISHYLVGLYDGQHSIITTYFKDLMMLKVKLVILTRNFTQLYEDTTKKTEWKVLHQILTVNWIKTTCWIFFKPLSNFIEVKYMLIFLMQAAIVTVGYIFFKPLMTFFWCHLKEQTNKKSIAFLNMCERWAVFANRKEVEVSNFH